MNLFNVPHSDCVGQIDELLDRIVASGLIGEQKLNQLLQEFDVPPGAFPVSRFGRTITGISAYLVRRGVLTCWQVEKLRSGKYKGFFYADDYWLLDCWGSDDDRAVYLAHRLSTGEAVVLEIRPGSPPTHRVAAKLGNSGIIEWNGV